MASYNIHPTVSEVNTKQGSALSNLFAGVDIFQSDLQVTGADLLNQFILDYGERAFMLPATAAEMAADYSGYATRVVQAFQLKYKTQLKYKYTKLLETMFYEYNPIWNVDGTETTDTTHNQSQTVTTDIETIRRQVETVTTDRNQTETVTTRNNQEIEHHIEKDRDYNYTEIDEPKKTTTEKPGTTITHNVTPYDSTDQTAASSDTASGTTTTEEEYNRNKFEYHNEDYTDTTAYKLTQGATDNGDTVRTEYSGDGDTVTTAYSLPAGTTKGDTVHNSVTTEYEGETPDNITTTRQGNIGVTSTQSLIQQEREIVDFDIIGNFLRDCSNLICLNVYIDTLEP